MKQRWTRNFDYCRISVDTLQLSKFGVLLTFRWKRCVTNVHLHLFPFHPLTLILGSVLWFFLFYSFQTNFPPAIVVMVLDMVVTSVDAGTITHYVCMALFPPYAILGVVYYIGKVMSALNSLMQESVMALPFLRSWHFSMPSSLFPLPLSCSCPSHYWSGSILYTLPIHFI